MSRPSPPVLTVRTSRSQGSFGAGRDIIVGSDLRADLRVAHPLICRAHLILRFDQGRWIAFDNNSLHGIFVNGDRVSVVDIHDGHVINLGKPDGPRIVFEVGHHQGIVGLLPAPQTARALSVPANSPCSPPRSNPPPRSPPPRPQAAYPRTLPREPGHDQ